MSTTTTWFYNSHTVPKEALLVAEISDLKEKPLCDFLANLDQIETQLAKSEEDQLLKDREAIFDREWKLTVFYFKIQATLATITFIAFQAMKALEKRLQDSHGRSNQSLYKFCNVTLSVLTPITYVSILATIGFWIFFFAHEHTTGTFRLYELEALELTLSNQRTSRLRTKILEIKQKLNNDVTDPEEKEPLTIAEHDFNCKLMTYSRGGKG